MINVKKKQVEYLRKEFKLSDSIIGNLIYLYGGLSFYVKFRHFFEKDSSYISNIFIKGTNDISCCFRPKGEKYIWYSYNAYKNWYYTKKHNRKTKKIKSDGNQRDHFFKGSDVLYEAIDLIRENSINNVVEFYLFLVTKIVTVYCGAVMRA